MKAQIFSMDLLVALALAVTSTALALHCIELVQRSADANVGSTVAAALAESIAAGSPMRVSIANCTAYSNGSNYCAGFSCPANTYAYRRIVTCEGGSSCFMEVRTCN